MSVWNYLRRVLWLARTGWLQSGVPPSISETVSQHSFASAALALEISLRIKSRGKEVDPYKAAALALVHDIAEGYIGDIPKYSSRLIDKRKLEEAPLWGLGELRELVIEFLDQRTLESKIAKLSDYLSTALVAQEYKKLGFEVEEILRSSVEAAKRMAEELGVRIDDFLEGFVERLP